MSSAFHELSRRKLRKYQDSWKVPVTIIGGFLGSGKTTTVNHALAQPTGNRIDVLVREFGLVSIDDELIKVDDPKRIHSVPGISMHIDEETLLYVSLDRLHEERHKKFDRLLIETSGTETPELFLHVFFLWDLPDMFRMGSFITLVDAEYGELDMDEYSSAVEQIALADVVVINKTELADSDKLNSLERRIRSVNAMASICRTTYGRIDIKKYQDTVLYDQLKVLQPTTKEGIILKDSITSYVLEEKAPLDKAKVNTWINTLFNSHGSKILRSKGFFNFAGEEYRYEFQAVRKTFHSYANQTWPENEERKTVLVLIGENLPDKNELGRSLAECAVT